MPELEPVDRRLDRPFDRFDPFDARLGAAVQGFADRAQTRVDAVAVANRAIGHQRTGPWAVLGRAIPVPVSILVLLALLLAGLAWTVQGGAPWERRTALVPAPMTTPIANPAPSATASPAPAYSPDGQGDERVKGTEMIVVVTQPAQQQVGAVLQMRGGAATVSMAMDDPRLVGTGTWSFGSDGYGTTATVWGTYHLQNAAGAWDGTCSGGTWNAGTGGVRTCSLAGTGGYAGYAYVFNVTQTALGSGVVEGVIYPGPIQIGP